VVVSYGHILDQPFLEAPVLGCINIHGSLLPRWRGAAPIHRAILAGDAETGVTTMRMDEGLDTGPMLLAERTPIRADDTAATVHDRLAALGATLIVSTLDGLVRRSIDPTPQPTEGVTYAHKLGKHESLLDWRGRRSSSSARCGRSIPGPAPSVQLRRRGRSRCWARRSALASGRAGTRASHATAFPVVACGVGGLRLLRLQRPGKARRRPTLSCAASPCRAGTVLPFARPPCRCRPEDPCRATRSSSSTTAVRSSAGSARTAARRSGRGSRTPCSRERRARLRAGEPGRTDAGVMRWARLALSTSPAEKSAGGDPRRASPFHLKPQPVVVRSAELAPAGFMPGSRRATGAIATAS
jgi:methionyl-tRNA formyltransferase